MARMQPLSPVAAQVMRRAQAPTVTAAELGQLISLAPPLAASLLRLANSPFFGLSRTVSSVSQAVVILGVSATVRLVSCAALAEPLKQVDAAVSRERWEHYVGTAVYAQRLIEDDSVTAGLAFTAGLLCDIGQVYLLQRHGRSYAQLLADHADEESLQARELEHFGQSHATLGADLLQDWDLPATLVDAARYHPVPQPQPGWSRVQRAVWLGDRLASGGEAREQTLALRLDGLAEPAHAIEQGRPEVDALKQLVGG